MLKAQVEKLKFSVVGLLTHDSLYCPPESEPLQSACLSFSFSIMIVFTHIWGKNIFVCGEEESFSNLGQHQGGFVERLILRGQFLLTIGLMDTLKNHHYLV